MQIGRDTSYESKTPTWTSRFYSSNYYILEDFQIFKFGSITVKKENLKKGLIIDTGSSYFIVPKNILEKITQQIYDRCRRMGQKCQIFTGSNGDIVVGMLSYKSYDQALADMDKNFHKIEITINAIKTVVKPSEYFIFV